MGRNVPKDLISRPHSLRTCTTTIKKASNAVTTRSETPFRHNNNKSNVKSPKYPVGIEEAFEAKCAQVYQTNGLSMLLSR